MSPLPNPENCHSYFMGQNSVLGVSVKRVFVSEPPKWEMATETRMGITSGKSVKRPVWTWVHCWGLRIVHSDCIWRDEMEVVFVTSLDYLPNSVYGKAHWVFVCLRTLFTRAFKMRRAPCWGPRYRQYPTGPTAPPPSCGCSSPSHQTQHQPGRAVREVPSFGIVLYPPQGRKPYKLTN